MSDECRCGQPDCGWLPVWDEAMRRLSAHLASRPSGEGGRMSETKCRHVGGTEDCPTLCLYVYGSWFVTERNQGEQ